MNAEGRKRLAVIVTAIENAKVDLEALAEEEREKVENMPDGLRDGDRGQEMDEKTSVLEEAVGNLDDVQSALGEVAQMTQTCLTCNHQPVCRLLWGIIKSGVIQDASKDANITANALIDPTNLGVICRQYYPANGHVTLEPPKADEVDPVAEALAR